MVSKPARLSDDAWVNIKVGFLISAAVALCTATVWLYQIRIDSAQALAELREFRGKMEPIIEQHRRLWWDYELRTASHQAPGVPGP
jgi:hypothetical protein